MFGSWHVRRALLGTFVAVVPLTPAALAPSKGGVEDFHCECAREVHVLGCVCWVFIRWSSCALEAREICGRKFEGLEGI